MSLATISPGITFLLLCTATFLSTVGAFLAHKKYSSRPINVANKICGSGLIILSVVMLAAIISWWSILFILLSIFTILHYTSAYAQRNGLLKKYIEDIAKQKESLLKHKESIVIGREIANQQPLIWVLDMEDEFINNSINEYNKLLAMKYFIQKQLK